MLGLTDPYTGAIKWGTVAMYVVGAMVLLWVVRKLFTPCPTPSKKEGMANGCGCAKKAGSGNPWIPFAS